MNNLSLRDYETFSAYLDGQLSPDETRRFESELKAHPEWRSAIQELEATRAVLRRAPRYRAPRNFTISPELARQYQRKSWLPAFASFRLSAAVSAFSLLAVMVLQLLPGVTMSARLAMAPQADSAGAQMEALPTNAAVMKAAEPQAAAPEALPALTATAVPPASLAAGAGLAAQATPPVILWGNNSGMLGSSNSPAYGRGGGGGGNGSVGAPCAGDCGIVTYNNQNFAAPKAADGYTTPPTGSGIVVYGGVAPESSNTPLTLPPTSAEGLSAAPQAAPEIKAGETTMLEGNGPILGVAAQDTAGQIIATGPISEGVQGPGPIERNAIPAPAEQPAPAFWTGTRIAQAALLGLAVLAGALALFLRLKR
jgi:hypothetical protein